MDGRVPNRIVRLTDSSLEYEADLRQAERHIEAMHLDGNCKSTVTPGRKKGNRPMDVFSD